MINGGEVVDDEKMYTKYVFKYRHFIHIISHVFFLHNYLSFFSFRYFVHLNNTLFQALFEVASTPDRILKPEVIQRVGLDPKADLTFLNDLTELYGIDVQIPEPTCCPFYEPIK